MIYQEILTEHPALKRFVLCYWELRSQKQSCTFRHLPKAQSMIVWNQGGQLRVDGSVIESTLVVLRPCQKAQQIEASLPHLFGVSLINDGLFRLTGMPLSDQLPSHLGARLESLAWDSLVEFSIQLENVLQQKITVSPRVDSCLRVLDRINQTAGCQDLSSIYNDCGVSERTFQRYCNKCIGLTPKQYASLVRINFYLEKVLTNTDVNWMDLVVRHAYHDQAHFIKAFKGYAQMSPTKLKAKRDTLYHHLMRGNVGNLQ